MCWICEDSFTARRAESLATTRIAVIWSRHSGGERGLTTRFLGGGFQLFRLCRRVCRHRRGGGRSLDGGLAGQPLHVLLQVRIETFVVGIRRRGPERRGPGGGNGEGRSVLLFQRGGELVQLLDDPGGGFGVAGGTAPWRNPTTAAVDSRIRVVTMTSSNLCWDSLVPAGVRQTFSNAQNRCTLDRLRELGQRMPRVKKLAFGA